MELVAQPSRLRVRAVSRRSTGPEHEARRPVNPLAWTPALPSLARFRGSKREIQVGRSLAQPSTDGEEGVPEAARALPSVFIP